MLESIPIPKPIPEPISKPILELVPEITPELCVPWRARTLWCVTALTDDDGRWW